ncbi:hypothetical protein OEZ86_005491 [Tetradesmus obliquus]|nr:hypothetical protein OEZ86_005491 [Tetradesmus obliquus]
MCGHRLKEHTEGHKCSNRSCSCPKFSFIVAEGSWILRCRCKHKHTEHDPSSHACSKASCSCSGFSSPWVCNCDHPWTQHQQVLVERQVLRLRSAKEFGLRLRCLLVGISSWLGVGPPIASQSRGSSGCATQEPTPEAQKLIRKKLAEGEAAAKRRAAAVTAAARGGVGIASVASAGLLPPATATVSLVFHIIVDYNDIISPGGGKADTAAHRDPANPGVQLQLAGLPTCNHLNDDGIVAQVAKLNEAYRGTMTFVTEKVYRYRIADVDPSNPPAGACVESTACYDGINPILISYYGWWDTRNNGHHHAAVYGDFNTQSLQLELAAELSVARSSSQLNVYMWDWDTAQVNDMGGAFFYEQSFDPFVVASGFDMVFVHCESAVGGNGAKIDLDPGDAYSNTPYYSQYAAPYYSGGELIGHALGLYHPDRNGCEAPFGGDEVDDTPAEDDRGWNANDPPFWCPSSGTVMDTCPGEVGTDLKNNYMHAADQYDDTCRALFTPGQLSRVRNMWAAFRKPRGCLSGPNALAPAANAQWPTACTPNAGAEIDAGSVCVAACSPGYEPDPTNGAPSTTCDATGRHSWGNALGSCRATTCSNPPIKQPNAEAFTACQTNTPGASCSANCIQGITGGGSVTATCTATNMWTITGVCQLKSCSTPPAQANHAGVWFGASCLPGATYGSSCQAACLPGFVAAGGQLAAACTDTDTWTITGGPCNAAVVRCGGLPAPPPNAVFWFGASCEASAVSGSTCSATCLPTATGSGYTLTCSASGNWVQSGSGCTAAGPGPATCGGLPAPPPGTAIWFGASCVGGATVGSSCQASCQAPATGAGYTLSCTASGWQQGGSGCTAPPCGGLPASPPGFPVWSGASCYANAPLGSSCASACPPPATGAGFTLTCIASGWVQSGGSCSTSPTCGALPNPPLGANPWGGITCFSPAPGGSSCTASCVGGAAAGSGYTIVCTQSSWILQSGGGCGTSTAATCSSNPTPSRPPNTQDWVGCAGVLVGSTCTASCLPGAVGGYTSRCTAKDTWDTSGSCILTGVANIASANLQLVVRYSGACSDTATGALLNSLTESLYTALPQDRTQFSLEVTTGNCTAVASKRSVTRAARPAATESNQPMAIKVTEALGNALSTSGQAIQALQDWFSGLLASGWCSSSSAALNACISVIRTTGGQEINAPVTGQQMSAPVISTNPPTVCLAGQQLTAGSCSWCPAGTHNPIPGATCVKCSAVADVVTAVSGQRTRIKPLANDFGQSLKIGAVTAPSKGGRVFMAADSVTLLYLSAAGFVGIDTFTYTTQGSTQPATVTVNVTVGSCDSNSCTLGACNVTTGTCDCKGWLGMVATFVPNSDPVGRRITPRVPACRYPVFALANFNASTLLEAVTNANIPVNFTVSRNPQRCHQAVILAIGFTQITGPVNATNAQTALGNACLAGKTAGRAAQDAVIAGQAAVANGEADDDVSTQTVEIKALYQVTCTFGRYSVKVQTPATAGCYYFVLHLADGSRQTMVLRATGGTGN